MIILDVAVLAVLPGTRADLKGSVCQCHYCNCARGNRSKQSLYVVFILYLFIFYFEVTSTVCPNTQDWDTPPTAMVKT